MVVVVTVVVVMVEIVVTKLIKAFHVLAHFFVSRNELGICVTE
jgi:hypothetical protein